MSPENEENSNDALFRKKTRMVTSDTGKKYVLSDEKNSSSVDSLHVINEEFRHQEVEFVKDEKEKGGFFSFLFELVIIFLIVFGVRSFIATPFQVEGHSMDDTLQDKEKIFINKLVTMVGEIHRGDIVVFKPPYYSMMPNQGILCKIKQKFSKETSMVKLCGEEPRYYVKRVIGVAGDTVKVQHGDVFLKKSGETEFTKLEEKYLNEENSGNTCFSNATCSSERDQEGYEFVVPEGKILVFGDNRLHSTDSRSAFSSGSAFNNGEPEPFVPLEYIVGTVKLVIWPPENWKWFGSRE